MSRHEAMQTVDPQVALMRSIPEMAAMRDDKRERWAPRDVYCDAD